MSILFKSPKIIFVKQVFPVYIDRKNIKSFPHKKICFVHKTENCSKSFKTCVETVDMNQLMLKAFAHN